MKKSVLTISLAIIVILAFSFSVIGAGVNNCAWCDSLYGQSKSNVPPVTCSMAGTCESHSSPPLPPDNPCPCQDNACAFLLEKKKADFMLAQWDGSQVMGLNGFRTEKVPLIKDRREVLIPDIRSVFLYLHLQNLRC